MELEAWRTAALFIAAAGQTAFVIWYAQLRWWETVLGKALFFKGLTLMLTLDTFAAARIWNWTGEDETFIVLYCMLAFAVWVQTLAFWAQDRKHRKEGKERDEAAA